MTTVDTEATGNTVEVELADYEFKGQPASVPAGTKLTMANTSSVEFHELVAFRLPDGEERTAEEILALPEEEAGAIFGSEPATVLLAGPDGGEPIPAVGDGTLEEPGRYLLLMLDPDRSRPRRDRGVARGRGRGPAARGPRRRAPALHRGHARRAHRRVAPAIAGCLRPAARTRSDTPGGQRSPPGVSARGAARVLG